MKTFRVRAIELANDCKRVKGNNVYETLSKEFNISKRTAGDRFKSFFGMPVRDYISDNITPSKEQLIDCIIKSDNYLEMYKLSGFNDISGLSKLMHNYFGNSNYFKLKNSLIAKIPNEIYYVNREDNESILISQYLGDGHIERHSSLSIEHGEKQYDYLKFKVGLINKAYPTTNGLEGIRKLVSKKTGYVSYRYRTNQVLGKQLSTIEEQSIGENINKLTPFGVCLYYLDDGWLTYNHEFNTAELGLSSICSEKREELIKYFKTYGFHFNETPTSINIQSKTSIIRFIKDFIEPYSHIIPKCIQCKYNYKDIVGEVY